MNEEINAIDATNEIDKAAELLDSQPTDGVQVYKLIKPVTLNGTVYTELKLDFDSLGGMDMEAIDEALLDSGRLIPRVREFSKSYQFHFVARAAKVPIEVIRALSLKDATYLSLSAMSFLISSAD